MTKRLIVLLAFFLFLTAFHNALAAEDKGSPYYDFGIFAFEDGDYQDAVGNFKKALSFNPDNPYYHYFLGKTYLALKDDDQAALHLKVAWGLDSEISGLRYDLATLSFKQSDYGAAADLFEGIASEDPNYVMARYYAGISRFKLKAYNQALPHLLLASEQSPTIRPNGYYYAGICYLNTGAYDRAIDKFGYVRDNAESAVLRGNAVKWLEASRSQKKAIKPYRLYAKVGYQYDSNILLDPVDLDRPTDEDDDALVAYLMGKYDFVRRGNFTLGAGYSHYLVNYDTLSEYDLSASMGDIYAQYKWDNLRFDLSYRPNYYWVDEKDYQASQQIRPALRWKVNNDFNVRFNYAYEWKKNFETTGRSGDINLVDLDLYYFFFDRRVQLFAGGGYGANRSDHTDFDYDQVRGRLGANFKLPLAFKLRLMGKINTKDYNYVDSRYDVERKDTRWEGIGSLSRKVYFDWLSAVLDYRYTRNDSNVIDNTNDVQIYDYKRQQVTVSLAASF